MENPLGEQAFTAPMQENGSEEGQQVSGDESGLSRKCGICLGPIKDGLPYVKCDCGKVYHATCGPRVGRCASCGAAIEDRMRVEPVSTQPSEECSCPLCGTVQPIDAKECKSCGALFEDEPAADAAAEFQCPECGRPVTADAKTCGCGAVFEGEPSSFECPECRAAVGADEKVCPGCGAVFE